MTAGGGDRGIIIEAVALLGDVVARFGLGHGIDPATALAGLGWSYLGVKTAFQVPGEAGPTIRVAVAGGVGEAGGVGRVGEAGGVGDAGDADEMAIGEVGAGAERVEGSTRQPAGVTRLPLHAPSEVVPEGVTVTRRQRLAAYAVVVREGRILLTQLSDRVAGGGRGAWTLPGGGVEEGEDPAIGLRREVWEETGQHLGEVTLVDLLASHWTGSAPSGQWEDYQVVRLVYRATIPAPSEIVVHDVGGTTAAARWVPVRQLDGLRRGALLLGDPFTTWLDTFTRA